jgi:pyruvate dehydrogenase E2 component (dihydrolipoyllysine-residue acetyltransferase)
MLFLQMADSAAAPAVQGGNKGSARVEELTRAQQAIARRAAESRATIPAVELSVEVDASAPLAQREAQSASITAMLVRACGYALREVPLANGAYRDGHFELYSRINVAVAVYTEDGFSLPTVFDADDKSASQVSEELRRLTERAVNRELTPPELSGSTFTLWDVGEQGIEHSGPLIVPGQAAALSAGTIREAPVVRGGVVVPGYLMTITLASDHRILYGLQASRFLTAVKSHLEERAI